MDDELVKMDLFETFKGGLENRLGSIETAIKRTDEGIKQILSNLHETRERALDNAERVPLETHLTCRKHDAFDKAIMTLEKNVTELWTKWNKGYAIILGTFVTLCLNLIVVITMLIRTWAK